MRVLFAITKGEIGGAQEHVRILAEGMMRAGHEVGIVVSDPSPLADGLRSKGAWVFAWPSIVRNPSLVKDLRARRELRSVVSSFGPDVLHLHSAKAGLLGRMLGPAHHTTIYTVHHLPFGPGRQWTHRLLARPIEQLALRRADGIITVGARDVPALRRLAPATPIGVIRNAVPKTQPSRSEAPRGAPTAVWVARLRRPKDPVQAVRSWAHVVRALPDARLVICGGGPLLDAVRRAAARSAAASNIDVLGHVDDLGPHVAAASLYLLTTDVEGGTTMATLEAMSAGLVPVVSDAGDAVLYEVARCGIVVPRRSPRSVAAAVVRLFGSEAMLAEMRSRAIAFTDSWTTEQMVEATLDFYTTVLDG